MPSIVCIVGGSGDFVLSGDKKMIERMLRIESI